MCDEYVRVGVFLTPVNLIRMVNLSKLESDLCVEVHISGIEEAIPLFDGEAVDFVLRVCPSALEGKRLKWVRHAWTVHNIIGHPLMQVLAWFGFRKLGLRVHDATVPHPKR